MKVYMTALTLSLLVQRSVAQTTNDIVDKLTGGDQKAWMYKTTIPTLGGNQCKNGKYLIFTKDTLIIKTCNAKKGQWELQKYKWWIIKQNEVSWELVYNGQKYFLDFKSKGAITELSLSSEKTEHDQEIYTYEE